MRSIERRDTGESYEAFVRRLAEGSGIETPTRAELARFDRSLKNKKTSNEQWQSPQDPDAKVAKMKDGRTHLAHKAEHGVDLETGAIVAVTVQDAAAGDSATLPETLTMAAEQVEAVQPDGAGVEEVVADKDSPAVHATPTESPPRAPVPACNHPAHDRRSSTSGRNPRSLAFPNPFRIHVALRSIQAHLIAPWRPSRISTRRYDTDGGDWPTNLATLLMMLHFTEIRATEW